MGKFVLEDNIEAIEDLGVFQVGEINSSDIVLSEWVRGACEENRCGKYGTNWACPPGLGSLDEARELFKEYPKGFVYTGLYQLEKETSYRQMLESMSYFSDLAYKLDDFLKERLDDYKIFDAGECTYCKECSYPEPCRFEDKRIPALEGMGIDVSALVRAAGVNYSLNPKTIIYIGLVIYKD